MSAQTVIDSLEFVRAERELHGSVAVGSLGRVQDCLYDTEGVILYSLKGGRDEEKRPVLALEIRGTLNIRCQRCLGPLKFELRGSNRLRLLAPGEKIETTAVDPESPDFIEASAGLDVVALVEEEIVLSLPMSPRHDESSCPTRGSATEGASQRPSAFARLAELKRVVDHRK